MRTAYLPAIACGGGGGRGRAPGSGPAAPGAPSFLRLLFGFRLVVGGVVAPARSPGAIESGLRARALRGSACSAARRLGDSEAGLVPARGDSRCGDVRGALPPASAWNGAPRSAECAGRSRGRWSPLAAELQPPPPPPPLAPSRRQDALAPVVMVTAALLNERLSDTRAPDVARGAPRSWPPQQGAAPEGAGQSVGSGLGAPPHGQGDVALRRTGTARTLRSLSARRSVRSPNSQFPCARYIAKAQEENCFMSEWMAE